MTLSELNAMVEEKKFKDIASYEAKTFQSNTQILLLTANDNELKAVLTFLKPLQQNVLFKYIHTLRIGFLTKSAEYIFGRFGAFNAAVHLLAKQGSAATQDAVIVADDCFGHNLHAIFAVGVACGVEKKNDLLDVLVSDKITCYNATRYGTTEDGIIEKRLRGEANLNTSSCFIEYFKSPLHWPNENSKIANRFSEVPKMHLGLILSGDILIDNEQFKQELLKNFVPDAIGIEMEGAGLLHSYYSYQVTIVKAVCDFGDGKKSKFYQPTAALLAAECLHHYLSNKTMQERLGDHMKSKISIISRIL